MVRQAGVCTRRAEEGERGKVHSALDLDCHAVRALKKIVLGSSLVVGSPGYTCASADEVKMDKRKAGDVGGGWVG